MIGGEAESTVPGLGERDPYRENVGALLATPGCGGSSADGWAELELGGPRAYLAVGLGVPAGRKGFRALRAMLAAWMRRSSRRR